MELSTALIIGSIALLCYVIGYMIYETRRQNKIKEAEKNQHRPHTPTDKLFGNEEHVRNGGMGNDYDNGNNI